MNRWIQYIIAIKWNIFDNKNIWSTIGYKIEENDENIVTIRRESAKVFEDMGFDTYPKHDEKRTDIIQNIILNIW